VIELFSKVANYPGVKNVGISHFALSSVESAPGLIEELSEILKLKTIGQWMSGQCGIETASPKLIGQLMAGKAKPFMPEQWPKVVENAFQTLNDNNWVPCATIILGLPDEQQEDVQLTLDLVQKLHKYKSLIVPLFMVSEGGLKGKATSFTIDMLTPKRSELFLKCWEHNLDWSEDLINEYFMVNRSKGLGAKMIFNYGAKQARQLIRTCEKDYDYNMPAMIKDVREGKITVTPSSVRLIYNLIKPKKKQEIIV
jgi:radical SAM superfamily enzyme YgiQ (UPF0313 family)